MTPLRAAALSALTLAALTASAPAQFTARHPSTTPTYYQVPQVQYQPVTIPTQQFQVQTPNYPHLGAPDVEKAGAWWLTAVAVACLIIVFAILARIVVVSRAKTNPYLLPADDWWLTQGRGAPPDPKGTTKFG